MCFVRLGLICAAVVIAAAVTFAVLKVAVALAAIVALILAASYVFNFGCAFLRRWYAGHTASALKR